MSPSDKHQVGVQSFVDFHWLGNQYKISRHTPESVYARFQGTDPGDGNVPDAFTVLDAYLLAYGYTRSRIAAGGRHYEKLRTRSAL